MIKYLLLFSAVVALVSGDRPDPCPRHRGLPDGLLRGENRINGRSLYRLDLRSAIRGFKPNAVYRLRVHTTSRDHKFNDATLVIDPLDADCGFGKLIVDGDKLYSPKNCKDFVTTQQKEPMGRAHFKWEAPSCGCVHIRIRVHANSSYYIEDEYTQNGPLARTICSKARASTSPPEPTLQTTVKPVVKQISRDDKLNKLCTLIKGSPMTMLMKRERFVKNRQLDLSSEFEKNRLAIALEQRQIDTEKCCLQGVLTPGCFGDVRRRRIDQFCGTGEPDVPFTRASLVWIKHKEPECCWQIGEDRYHCFNYTIEKQRWVNDGRGNESQFDDVQDLDDFDPANDIDDFVEDEQEKEDKARESVKQLDHEMEALKGDDEEKRDIDNKDEDDDDGNDNESSGIDDPKGIKNKKVKHKVNDKDVYHEENSNEDDDDEENQQDQMNREPAGLNRDDVKDNLRDKILTPEECCFNGITAGTKVVDEGTVGCFKMADMFQGIFRMWNRTCDRKFVVCCMRVVEGMTKRAWLSRS